MPQDKTDILQELAWQYREKKGRIKRMLEDGPEVKNFWAVFSEWEAVRDRIRDLEGPADLDRIKNQYVRKLYLDVLAGKDSFAAYSRRLAGELAQLELENPSPETVEEMGPNYFLKVIDFYALRENYLERKKHVGALVVNNVLPEDVKALFSYLKDLYCFGFNAAAVTFCRALIESILVKKMDEKGLFRSDDKEVRLDEIKEKRNSILSMARNRHILSDGQRDRALEYVFRYAGIIIHEGRLDIATDEITLDAIIESMSLTRELLEK